MELVIGRMYQYASDDPFNLAKITVEKSNGLVSLWGIKSECHLSGDDMFSYLKEYTPHDFKLKWKMVRCLHIKADIDFDIVRM